MPTLGPASLALALALALAAASAAAPPSGEARLLMLVAERPVGEVSIAWSAGRYGYRSIQRLPGEVRRRVVELLLDGDRARPSALVPELLLLVHRPPPGCSLALEERSSRPERVCVDPDGAGGTIDGARFSARWGEDGWLRELSFEGARFVASTAPLTSDADPFAEGFPVWPVAEGPAQVALAPPAPGVEVLHRPPLGAGAIDRRADARDCLELARARARESQGTLKVIRGVVLEEGRAWPHAWLEEVRSGRAVDPSLPPDAPASTERTYLAFPEAHAGRLYLELLGGTRRITAPGPPRPGASAGQGEAVRPRGSR